MGDTAFIEHNVPHFCGLNVKPAQVVNCKHLSRRAWACILEPASYFYLILAKRPRSDHFFFILAKRPRSDKG